MARLALSVVAASAEAVVPCPSSLHRRMWPQVVRLLWAADFRPRGLAVHLCFPQDLPRRARRDRCRWFLGLLLADHLVPFSYRQAWPAAGVVAMFSLLQVIRLVRTAAAVVHVFALALVENTAARSSLRAVLAPSHTAEVLLCVVPLELSAAASRR